MQLSLRQQFAVLGGALVALVALVLVQGAAPPAPASAPRLTPEAAAPPAPSADNVAPAFHAQLRTLEARIEEAPRDTAALLQLARLHQDAHQLDEAADTYERLLAIAPDHRQAHLDLALVYAEGGRPDDARRATEALLARHPDDPAGRYNLGALDANAGDLDAARRVWTGVAAQTSDPALAEQARASLAQLDPLPASAPASGGATSPSASGALPAGHPALPRLEPILVQR